MSPIRPAAPEDAPAVAGIWNRYIRESTVTFTTEEKAAEALILDPARWRVLALPEVRGFASFGPFRAGPGYARTAELTIYLAAEVQGQGHGRALLSALEEAARAAGIHVLVAGFAGENAAAQAFHARAGYREVARMPEVGWKFGRWHDLVMMQKRL